MNAATGEPNMKWRGTNFKQGGRAPLPFSALCRATSPLSFATLALQIEVTRPLHTSTVGTWRQDVFNDKCDNSHRYLQRCLARVSLTISTILTTRLSPASRRKKRTLPKNERFEASRSHGDEPYVTARLEVVAGKQRRRHF